jgi:hypothetical protein
MAKYLLLKHYRGAPASVNDVAMDQWTPEEISAHVQYMHDFAARLERTGEFVDSQALAPEGTFVRYDGEGRQPVGWSPWPGAGSSTRPGRTPPAAGVRTSSVSTQRSRRRGRGLIRGPRWTTRSSSTSCAPTRR